MTRFFTRPTSHPRHAAWISNLKSKPVRPHLREVINITLSIDDSSDLKQPYNNPIGLFFSIDEFDADDDFDAALLRFAAAAEILETDFWVQYNEKHLL